MQAAHTDQPDQHTYGQNRERDSQVTRHYLASGAAVEPAGGREATIACTIAVEIGAAIAASSFGSETVTLEISTATAGAPTERNTRTGTAEDALGDPGNRCAKSACSTSARRLLASRYGRCASSQATKPGALAWREGVEGALVLEPAVVGMMSGN